MKYEPKDYHSDNDEESRSSSDNNNGHDEHSIAVPQPTDDGGVPHRRVSVQHFGFTLFLDILYILYVHTLYSYIYTYSRNVPRNVYFIRLPITPDRVTRMYFNAK